MRRHRDVRRIAAEVRREVQRYLEGRAPELRKTELDVPVFLSGHALESCLHAALDERPELLDDPTLAEELVDMLARYLLRDPANGA